MAKNGGTSVCWFTTACAGCRNCGKKELGSGYCFIAQFYDSYAALKADEPHVRRIIIAELSEKQQRSLDDLPKLTGLEDASDIHARRELREKTMVYIWNTLDRIKSHAFPEDYAAEKKHVASRREATKEQSGSATSRLPARVGCGAHLSHLSLSPPKRGPSTPCRLVYRTLRVWRGCVQWGLSAAAVLTGDR